MSKSLKRIVSIVCLGVLLCFLFVGCRVKTQPTVLRLAIPYSDNIQDINTNYYINWLEDRCGYDIEVSYIYNSSCEEYLEILFNSDIEMDAVLFRNGSIDEDKITGKN